jgi:hypothetical protein
VRGRTAASQSADELDDVLLVLPELELDGELLVELESLLVLADDEPDESPLPPEDFLPDEPDERLSVL